MSTNERANEPTENVDESSLETLLADANATSPSIPATEPELPQDLPGEEDLFPTAPVKPATKARATKTKAQAKAKTAAKAATKAPTRTHAPRGQGYAEHRFERKSEDYPCRACGEPWQHAKGFCSPCYNAARKPMKQGKTGAALFAEVRKVRGLTQAPKATPAPKARTKKAPVAAAK